MKKQTDFTIDCIAMKRRIQGEIARETEGMAATERLDYLREQVRKSPFAGLLKGAGAGSTHQ